MNSFRQLVTPRLDIKVLPGWCLGLVRQSFDVPAWEARATWQADKTKRRHHERKMPNVIVPVWFWHWGTYGGVTGEFGHVLLWVPGRGFLSSPAHSKWVGGVEVPWAQWFSSIEAVERAFGATYRFWSEDIGGVNVVTPSNDPSTPDWLDPFRYDTEDKEMNVGMYRMVGKTYHVTIGNFGSGFKLQYTTSDKEYNNKKATQFKTGNFTEEDQSVIDRFTESLDLVRQGK